MQSGIEEGAEIFQPDCVLPDKGFFFRPTLFTGVSQSHRIAQEEIFGPVLSVLTFRTPEEAIEKANNTPYGLSAGVWTEKGSRIFKMVGAMRAGVVWANTFNRFDPTSPFGGYKESGYGREGGLHGLGAYLDLSLANGSHASQQLRGRRLMAERPHQYRAPVGAARSERRRPRRQRRRASDSSVARPTSSISAAHSRAPSPAAPTRSSTRAAGCWPMPAAARARTSATRSERRARRSRGGWHAPPSTADRSCTASPSSWRAAATSSSRR